MAVPSIADRYLPNCTTEFQRRRPVKGDPFVADNPHPPLIMTKDFELTGGPRNASVISSDPSPGPGDS